MTALGQHFEEYPLVPVYVNSEVIETVRESGKPWAENVFAVEGFDYETTNEVLRESLAAGADLADLNVPLFAVAASAARNLHGWWKGAVPLNDLPSEIVMDGAVHGGLSVAGGFTGAAIGGLVFGPAGAVVFGGVGGVAALFGGSRVGRLTRRLWYRTRHRSLQEAVEGFHAALRIAMEAKIRRKRDKIDRMEQEIDRAGRELASPRAKASLWWQLVAPWRADLAMARQVGDPVGTGSVQSASKAPAKIPTRSSCSGCASGSRTRSCALRRVWQRLNRLAESGRLTKDTVRGARDLFRLMRESSVHPLSVKKEFGVLTAALTEMHGRSLIGT